MNRTTGARAAATQPRFKRYPAYKASGVEWPGEIPAHWEVAPVYARYEVALGKMLDAKRVTGNSSGCYLRNIDVQWDAVNTHGLPKMDFAKGERDRYLLRPGDLLVCEGGEVGRTAIWRGQVEECFYQKAIHRVRPRSETEVPRFFYYLMYVLAKRGVFVAGGNPNTIDHLTGVQLKGYRLPFAPPQEQGAIAAFLDRETTRIDALVAKKERLIELLEEKRTSHITRAVTKGLDPHVPMKDSGVEWLGETPAHWAMTKMWDVVSAVSGATPPKDVLKYWDGGIPWVSAKDMKRRLIDSSEDTVSDAALSETGLKLISAPAVLVVVRGMILAHTFPVAITTVPITINQDMKALRLRENLKPQFFAYWLHGVGRDLLAVLVEEASHGTKAIRMDRWRITPVQMPPVHEQDDIVEFLDRETARIDALMAKVGNAIDRLKELRIALVSAAVTGKIDVRAG